jgi:membrane protease subunit HflK
MSRKIAWPHWFSAVSKMSSPWGSGDDSGGKKGGNGGNTGGSGPHNPWGNPADGTPPPRKGPSTIEELFKKGSGGGRGGGFNPRMPRRADGKSWWPLVLIGLVVLWAVFTSVHRVSPKERGVVTFFGNYSRTLGPGLHFSLPTPFESVQNVDVEEIRTIDIPEGESEKLILTGDQNIVDLAYSVRWNIRSTGAEQYLFQLADPDETIKEVAEAAMRAAIANFTLDDTIGAERAAIEQQVQVSMQAILDEYGSGVIIRGVAIKKADPPAAVNDAFKAVSAAQQEAQTYRNEARAYAQQLTAQAQGEAAAFDKVYEEYRLSPEVTRRRMYYETMERVLSKVDKTIVEAPGVTPYIALPEVKRRAQAAPAPAAASGGGK